MKRSQTSRSLKRLASAGQKQSVAIDWKNSPPFKIPIPKNEKQRLADLQSYKILDTPPEENFDHITALAAHICGTPIALITLIDSDRQWFKSKVGMTVSETSRDVAFCAHAIMQHDLFVVADAAHDQRFATNPLVTAKPKIRFYAGVPLVNPEQHALGTLCVMDRVPRVLSPDQIKALRSLSQQAMAQMELRRTVIELKQNLLERRLAEKNLRKSHNSLDTAHRARSEFLVKASLELRTTLSGMSGLMDQLLASQPAQRQKDDLQTLKSSTAALLDLAHNLSNLSRNEAAG